MSPALATPTARRRLAAAVGVVLLCGLPAGCTADLAPAGTATPGPGTTVAGTPAPDTGPPPSARVGTPAASERVTFVPQLLELPGNARAEVRPAATAADGQLEVPENVAYVGWWDGSARAGEPFGRTVIAGHVDAANGGAGFFARLKRVRKGDVVTLGAGEHRLSYRVTSKQTVARRALATDGRAFDQMGEHRLVLITCTGDYFRDRGGYESNLVVTGTPLGLAR